MATGRSGKHVWFWVFIVAVIVLTLMSLRSDRQSQSQPQRNTAEPANDAASVRTSPKVAAPSSLTDPSTQLDLFDLVMVKSPEIPLNGDLRPIWTVSGRIRNLTTFSIKGVQIQVHILYKSNSLEADSARFEVNTPIPPLETIAFKQDIQVQPPKEKWGWTYDVVGAKTDSGQ